jgi:hypothetical protein
LSWNSQNLPCFEAASEARCAPIAFAWMSSGRCFQTIRTLSPYAFRICVRVGPTLERRARGAEHFLEEVERALKFPYNVVYRVSGDLVRIYAIAHAKRRPGYWKSRLGWREPPI